jgi:hypothetical protein
MYKVLGAESCSGGDTQQPAAAAASAAASQATTNPNPSTLHQSNPHQKTSHPPSMSLLYPVVNKEVEQ